MRALFLGATAGLVLTGAALAQQESTNRVAVETAWSVFVEPDPTECWSVSSPEQTVNSDVATGAVKQGVQRGDILLFVTFRPGNNVRGEISFTGGYPFAEESDVTMEIGEQTFTLFTEGEWAWPTSDADDAKLIAAMKRGANAKLTGRSSRGTQTDDTFSLFGFTAAMDEAQKRCSS